MTAPEGKVPILISAAAGVRFWRDHWRTAGLIAIAGGAATGLLALVTLSAAPQLGIVLGVAQLLVQACAYAALLGLALGAGAPTPARIVQDGMRVFAAMAVIGFFLAIVCIVAMLPSMMILGMALAPFADRIEALGPNPEPTQLAPILAEAAKADPWPFVIVIGLYFIVWNLLTSRLYLAAPSTVAERAIRTFETWAWTKNNMLRIFAARLVLLAPAAMLVIAVRAFAGAALGVNALDLNALAEFAKANAPLYALVQFVSETANFFILFAFEAGLSAYLYRGLRGAQAAP
jgi:hypothetical protein